MKTFREFIDRARDLMGRSLDEGYPMPPHVKAYYDNLPQDTKDYHADLERKARDRAASGKGSETHTIRHFAPGNSFENPHKSMHHDVMLKMGLRHEFTTVSPRGEMGADTASHFTGPGHLRDRVERHLRHGYAEVSPGHFKDPHSSHSVRVTGGGSKPVNVVHRVKDNGGDNPQVDEKMRVKE